MNDSNPFASWRPQAMRLIDQMMQTTNGIAAVVISSEDGFEVASRADSDATASRISAMASSMSALGSLAAQESELGKAKTLLMEAESGLIVMVQAFHHTATLTVTVVSKRDAIMGQLLYACRQAARDLESL